ncbi:hypothetical protein T310_6049, partial [Rasamsonia emersonii CBS 393.64]
LEYGFMSFVSICLFSCRLWPASSFVLEYIQITSEFSCWREVYEVPDGVLYKLGGRKVRGYIFPAYTLRWVESVRMDDGWVLYIHTYRHVLTTQRRHEKQSSINRISS